MTQEALGRETQLDPKHIGGMERGEHGTTFTTVQRIAEVLQVEVHELFLPDRLAGNELESAVRAVTTDVGSLEPKAISDFFKEMLASVRRLEAAPRKAGHRSAR